MSAKGDRTLRVSALLTRQGWLEPAYVSLNADGTVRALAAAKPKDGVPMDEIKGIAIPGFQNAHSHAFQYAMAGLAEHLPAGAEADDFWSWREAMYRLAGKVSPDQVQAIATMLYTEMLKRGVTAVVEFHYLHHDPEGRSYKNPAEMGERLMAAAEAAGIHLTLIPIFYQRGGFAQRPSSAQARFLSRQGSDYLNLLDATRASAKRFADVTVGVGVHSLRAVAPEDVLALFSAPFSGPAHLHVAEQRREVEECIAHLKARPVDWLLDNLSLDARFSLVHATHMTASETTRLAASGATVVVCPSTEGNLGDGFFPFAAYKDAGGRYAIGTDSHIGLSPLEELRWLDYGQRLRSERRNVLCKRAGDDSGRILFEDAWLGGRAAMGAAPCDEYFEVGQPFDAVVLDPEHPVLYGRPPERRLAALLYAGDPSCFVGTLRRGAWLIRGGRATHDAKAPFLQALAALR